VFGWTILEMDGASRGYLDSSTGKPKEVRNDLLGFWRTAIAVPLF